MENNYIIIWYASNFKNFSYLCKMIYDKNLLKVSVPENFNKF